MDHLSSTDASFLHLETPETPMHVGSLMLFDLPEGYAGDYYEEVKAQLGKRLHLARLFHRKLAPLVILSAAFTAFAFVLVPLLHLGEKRQGDPAVAAMVPPPPDSR